MRISVTHPYYMYVTHTYYNNMCSSHSTSTRHFTRTHTCKIRSGPTAVMHIYIIGNILRILIGRISRASSSSLEVCDAARLQIDRRDNNRIGTYISAFVCSFILALCQCDFSVCTVCVCRILYTYELRALIVYFLLIFYLPPKTTARSQAPRWRRYYYLRPTVSYRRGLPSDAI